MQYDDALKILTHIESSSLAELVSDLISHAVAYAQIRVAWNMADPEERRQMDAGRSRAHAAFIDACNILSRNQPPKDEDNSWREALGFDRKEIGDFACCIHCVLGIRAK